MAGIRPLGFAREEWIGGDRPRNSLVARAELPLRALLARRLRNGPSPPDGHHLGPALRESSFWWLPCGCGRQGSARHDPRPDHRADLEMQSTASTTRAVEPRAVVPQVTDVVVPVPQAGAKFDPMTGQPVPKFDPFTGQQNWSEPVPPPNAPRFESHDGPADSQVRSDHGPAKLV